MTNKLLSYCDHTSILNILVILLESDSRFEVFDLTDTDKTHKLTLEMLTNPQNDHAKPLVLIDGEKYLEDKNNFVSKILTSIKNFENSRPTFLSLVFTENSLENITENDCFPLPNLQHFHFSMVDLNLEHLRTWKAEIEGKFYGNLSESQKTVDFKRIQLKSFYYLSTFKFDLYLALSESKFIKIIHDAEKLPIETIDKYNEKGVRFLYLKIDDFDRYLDCLWHSYQEKQTIHPLSFEIIPKLQIGVFSHIQQLVIEMGISEQVVGLVNQTIKEVLQLAKGHKKIFSIIKILLDTPDYLTAHSLISTYVSVAIAQELHWDTPELPQKLIIASLMHDISFAHKKLALIDSLEKMELEGPSGLALVERKEIENHFYRSVQFLENTSLYSEEVKKMILDHHEKADGTGFPRKLRAINTSPLSTLFILTHEISDAIYRGPKTQKIHQFLVNRQKALDEGHYKSVIAAAIKVFSKNFS